MSAPAAVPFPWREVMAFGLGRLRWAPDAFWAASPREIIAAIYKERVTQRGYGSGAWGWQTAYRETIAV